MVFDDIEGFCRSTALLRIRRASRLSWLAVHCASSGYGLDLEMLRVYRLDFQEGFIGGQERPPEPLREHGGEGIGR